MFTLRIAVFLLIIPLEYELCYGGCSHAEYEIDKQCCPMCAPGNRVIWHCTDDTSTTCSPCPESTFINEPNGLMKCFSCTVCDASQGLRQSKACSRSSDAFCAPLERFYCVDKNKGSCILALPHSECRPGQYIKQAGTGSTDTLCAECTGDTYSNGSFSSCLPHTKCEAMGLTETNPGTHSSDSECGKSSTFTIIIVCVSVVALSMLLASVFLIKHFWKKKHSGMQETIHDQDKKNSPVVGGRTNVEPDTLEEVRLKNLNDPTETTADFILNISTQSEDISVKPENQCLQEQTALKTKPKQPQKSLFLL